MIRMNRMFVDCLFENSKMENVKKAAEETDTVLEIQEDYLPEQKGLEKSHTRCWLTRKDGDMSKGLSEFWCRFESLKKENPNVFV